MVVEANSRLLVVKVAAPFWQTALCVARAPHDGAAQAERQEWWRFLGDCATKFGIELLFIDANGRVGDVRSQATGTSCADAPEDDNGALLRETMCETQLVAATTFSQPESDACTYTCTQGTRHRIDHVVAQLGWQTFVEPC